MSQKSMRWVYGPMNDKRSIQIQPARKVKLSEKNAVDVAFIKGMKPHDILRDGTVRPSAKTFRHNGKIISLLQLRRETLEVLYECIGDYLREN